MTKRFSLKTPLAANTHVDLDDAIKTKIALQRLGYYKAPGYGMTPYPDAQLFDAVSNLQRDKGMRATGEVRPGEDTEKAIRTALDTNSSGASARAENEGKYIWRTRGDCKVRSEHAERDGKVFEWNNPPDGGHPGEAPNCRCWAEAVEDNKAECARLKAQLEVDGNNLDGAKRRWERANRIVDETSSKLANVRHRKAAVVSEVRRLYGPIGVSILFGGRLPPKLPVRMAKLISEYIELELEHTGLGEQYKNAVYERDLVLRDAHEARKIYRRTLDRLRRHACDT